MCIGENDAVYINKRYEESHTFVTLILHVLYDREREKEGLSELLGFEKVW